ncbi:hypothetical protein GH808_14455 [Acetobacterium fimetarium]|uniref:Asparagine synthetase domain-containing protein n=1 Tax=Acetobacterium fimetarium TaxID=52691 RepID=A0ABR6WYA1_9FIRM|nr:hypothetical protein [Acetobacterium fimetarium]MBC3805608.1 hypothetical protein [Acetobacterium fimetarium]
MANLKKHRKQWFISNDENLQLENLADFQTISIGEQMVLHYDRDLKLSNYDWPDGRKTLVLGLIIGIPKSPETMHDNCGRFVAITAGILSLDATGSMGVFYSTEAGSQTSGIICGSSCALISEVTRQPLSGRGLGVSRLKGVHRMNWDPSPLARIAKMKRLFIDQEIDLKNGSISVSQRFVLKTMNSEEGASRLAEELVDIASGLKNIQRPIYLALTGGSDSRTVFSALIKEKIDFKAFTLLLDDEISSSDARIAAALCQRFDIQHESIGAEAGHEDELDIFTEHSGGCGGDRADKYVLGNYYRNLPDDAIVLHGGAFEIGQRSYEAAFRDVRFSDSEKMVIDLERDFDEKLDEKEQRALKEWFVYRKEHSIEGVDWVDSFFIDQRRGAWGAANRQAEDCFAFDWLIFANSWSLIEVLLSVSVDDRRNNVIQKRAMDLLVPGIVTIEAINPKGSLFRVIRKLGAVETGKKVLQVMRKRLRGIMPRIRR